MSHDLSNHPIDIIPATIGAAVATDGTINFPYPTGRTAASYFPVTSGAKMWIEAHETLLTQGAQTFTLSYGGAGNIVATYKGATTIPAGTFVSLEAPVKNFNIQSDPDQAQAHLADLTEDSGEIGGTNDGDLPDLDATAAVEDSDNTELLADVAALRAAVRELAARSNEHNDVLITAGIVAES